ncbi:MAG: MerR family transcriptional regulator [Eubacterium sp.]|nr:MerR family transcriptional regulator [Eubacterium sp.]
MENKEYYTAGELAKMSGTTYKSIRVYVEKELLIPDRITEAGYKLFSRESVERLQRILMFKYLDFSLEEIRQLLEKEEIRDSLGRQSKLIEQRITHLRQIKKAVNEMQKLSKEKNWDKMLEIMQLTSQKEELINQYAGTKKLEARINIHQYSTAKVEWFDYLFKQCDVKEGMAILDIGCGNGQLWIKEKDALPKNLKVVLVDNSKAMIDSARSLLETEMDLFEKKQIQFSYLVGDATKLGELEALRGRRFQRIFANHMLYHIEDSERKNFFITVKEMLEEDGKLIASTIGEDHMKELWELAIQYDDSVKVPGWFAKGFSLENGKGQLEEVFSKVERHSHDDNLLVPDWRSIYDYMCSLPGGIETVMKKRKKECEEFLRNKVTDQTPFFITKRTGVFVAKKK